MCILTYFQSFHHDMRTPSNMQRTNAGQKISNIGNSNYPYFLHTSWYDSLQALVYILRYKHLILHQGMDRDYSKFI